MSMTQRPVPGTQYVEDETELWAQGTDTINHEIRPATFEEARADRALATVLHTKYILRHTRDNFRMCDWTGDTTTLKEKFEEFGYLTTAQENLDLVTSVHTFQHFNYCTAIYMLQWAAERLKPNGYLFIRMPDHDVPGYERDLEKKFPCFWNLTSFLAALDKVKKLRIVETYTIEPGQRDYFLQVFDREPIICAGMIVKNEERDLPKALESLSGVIQGLVLRDTGSTDDTINVAFKMCCRHGWSHSIEQYLDASEKDDKGDWKLWDFGKARNSYLDAIDKFELAEGIKADWVLWMDADDIALDPKKLRNLKYLWSHDVHGVRISAGGSKWVHHRLWKNNRGIRYQGRCHEYPGFGAKPSMVHDNITIFHDAAPGVGENANKRNLRILEREFQESPTPRTAFYLANTHKDGCRFKEAVKYYDERIKFGKGYEDEYWFAVLYKARCQATYDSAEAKKTLLQAVAERPDWAEFWMELCYLENDAKQSKKSLAYSLIAQDMPVVPTQLFRERNKYEDQPYRMGSFGAEAIGEKELALKFALKAKEYIGGPDQDWDKRINSLRSPMKTEWVCWCRPGALGDIILTLNLIRPFKKENPNVKIRYACHPTSMHLEPLIRQAGADDVISSEDLRDEKTFYLRGYPLDEGYPEKPMRKHLLEFFADELGIQDRSQLFDSFFMEDPERTLEGPYCTVHVQAGWSPYKNWPVERWEEICRVVSKHMKVIQIGGPKDPRLLNVTHSAIGMSFMDNLNMFAHSKFHLGIDSWSNHASNIQWAKGKTRSLILWGSTQASAAGYNHNRNISLGLSCQPCFREDPKISAMSRGICPNPTGQTYENPQHACMAGISIDRVATELTELLTK